MSEQLQALLAVQHTASDHQKEASRQAATAREARANHAWATAIRTYEAAAAAATRAGDTLQTLVAQSDNELPPVKRAASEARETALNLQALVTTLEQERMACVRAQIEARALLAEANALLADPSQHEAAVRRARDASTLDPALHGEAQALACLVEEAVPPSAGANWVTIAVIAVLVVVMFAALIWHVLRNWILLTF